MASHAETPPARRRYNTTVTLWLVIYAGFLGLAAWAKYYGHIGAPMIFLIAALPALPIGFIILAMMRLIRDSDEYFRDLMMKRYMAAMGLTLFICTLFGFVDQYALNLRPPLWVVFPGYWMCYGLILPVYPSVK